MLSAVAFKAFTAETVGWSLGPDSVTVDLRAAALLTKPQLVELEALTNAQVRAGVAVDWTLRTREEIASMEEMRGMVKGAAAELSHLRIVSIAGLDLNPCGGTHLRSASEIQLLKIIGVESDKGATRVRFVAGDRALAYFSRCVEREASLCTSLCTDTLSAL